MASGLVQDLRQIPVFRHMSGSQLARIEEASTLTRLLPGAVVLEEDSPSTSVFVLLKGMVGVFYSTPEGEGLLVKIFGAPAMFGEMEMLTNLPRLEYVETMGTAEVLRIDGSIFAEVLMANAKACFEMLEDVCWRFCITAAFERTLAFEPVEARLAGVLWSFLQGGATSHADGVRLPVRLTQSQLARCIGATKRSVERAIQTLTRDELLFLDNGYYVIRSMPMLRQKVPDYYMNIFARLDIGPHSIAA